MSTDRSTSPPLPPPVLSTDEFVELFTKDPAHYDKAIGRLVTWGILPEGVDDNDPRVMAVFDEALQRGVEQLTSHCIEIRLRTLSQEAARTYPSMKLVAFGCHFRDGEQEREFWCEFFFEGPKKFERGLKLEDLAKSDGKKIVEKLVEFIDTALVDAMKTGL